MINRPKLLTSLQAVPSQEGIKTSVGALATELNRQVLSVQNVAIDQTGAAEQVHVTYPIPSNFFKVGMVLRCEFYGNTDNGASAINFTPTVRLGGLSGTIILQPLAA